MPQPPELVKGPIKESRAETPPAKAIETAAEARDQIRKQKLEDQRTEQETRKLESDLLEAQLIDRKKSEVEVKPNPIQEKAEDANQ